MFIKKGGLNAVYKNQAGPDENTTERRRAEWAVFGKTARLHATDGKKETGQPRAFNSRRPAEDQQVCTHTDRQDKGSDLKGEFMKRKLSISSMAAAIITTVWGAENNMIIPALIGIGYAFFWLWVNKRPRAATRSQNKKLYLYDITTDARFQERIRILKAREDYAVMANQSGFGRSV